MDGNNRRLPPVQRGNIDGIQARRPDTPPAQAAENTPAPDSQEPKQQAPPEQKVKNPTKNLLVIILAVLILVGLSGLAIYAGLQKNSNNSNDGQSEQTSSEQGNNSENSAELIDQTINEIDQLGGESDSSGQDLSDEELGL